VNKLTSEQKAEKIKEKRARQEKMEACLILVKSFYKQNEKEFIDYVDSHKST
jgi:hypothetical protein